MRKKINELNDKIKELDKIAFNLETLYQELDSSFNEWLDKLEKVGDALDSDDKVDQEKLSKLIWSVIEGMQKKFSNYI